MESAPIPLHGTAEPAPAPRGPAEHGRRLSRRALILGLGGVAAGLVPVLPRVIRTLFDGDAGADPIHEREGTTPTRADLADVLAAEVHGTLPVFLPERLPAGWRSAPYFSRRTLEEGGRASFLNPAVEPGLFYRVGYTSGVPERLEQLITLTVRMAQNFGTPEPGAESGTDGKSGTGVTDGTPAGGTRSRGAHGPVEIVSGRYLTVRRTLHPAADVIVQGPIAEERAVREIARAVAGA